MTAGEVGGRQALIEALFREGAIRFGKFGSERGEAKPYRLDLDIVPGYPEGYGLAVEAFRAMAKDVGESLFDAVAGVAPDSLAFASPLAYSLGKPLLWAVESQDRVVGAARPGLKVLAVDGFAATGTRAASAVGALRRTGCVVEHVVVLVDELEGGRARLSASGVRLRAFTDVREIAQTLFDAKKVTKSDWQAVVKQKEGE